MADAERQVKEDVESLRKLALRQGLEPGDVEFKVVPRKAMVEFGAYILPYRYSHWTFGKEYGRMQKFHDLGLIEILEMVINSDPSRAFLLDSNTRVENQMVIAHVFAHCDFFRNNYWFSKTNRGILETEQANERRIRELEHEVGAREVERVLDTALSLQWYVDFFGQFRQEKPRSRLTSGPEVPRDDGPGERDLLKFVMENARLKPHEKEILSLVRDEAFYFLPNAMTKIMNEGWATYWHAQLMKEALPFEQFDSYAIRHAHLMGSAGLNPYKLGVNLYESIVEDWDSKHGRGAGREKIFEVRKFEDDVSFIRNHLTQKVCDDAGMFLYEEDPKTGEKTVTSTDVNDVRSSLVNELLNFGKPVIHAKSADHNRQGELYLVHQFDGRELDLDYAADVLKNLHGFWRRPLHLESVVEDDRILLSFNGEKAGITKVGKWEKAKD